MERSLFRRSLAAHLVSLLLLTVLVTASLFVSLRRSVDIWNVNRGQRLENLIVPIIADIYRREGMLDPSLIHDQLRRILTANVYAYVFTPDRQPVYIYSLGRRTLLYDEAAVNSELQRVIESGQPLTPILEGTEVIGYLSADTVGFTNDAANRRFLMSITGIAAIGLAAAMLVALAAAWLFSSRLAGEASAVAAGLRKISGGRRDVTFAPSRTAELREIGDSARRLQSQLDREERLRRQWMEDIAHDLRTPVAALKTQLEGMTDGYLTIAPERLSRLHDEVEHVEWLVSGLRELSHIESPESEVLFEPVDVGALVTHVVNALVSSEMNETPAVSVRTDENSIVRASQHLLRRAVENVVGNAVENVDTASTISVTVSCDEDECTIDVANTGYVNPDEIPRFFDRLYRGNRGSGRGSSGLGLPIAKSAVERHGGTIGMEQRGEFTHVFIRLPRTHA